MFAIHTLGFWAANSEMISFLIYLLPILWYSCCDEKRVILIKQVICIRNAITEQGLVPWSFYYFLKQNNKGLFTHKMRNLVSSVYRSLYTVYYVYTPMFVFCVLQSYFYRRAVCHVVTMYTGVSVYSGNSRFMITAVIVQAQTYEKRILMIVFIHWEIK